MCSCCQCANVKTVTRGKAANRVLRPCALWLLHGMTNARTVFGGVFALGPIRSSSGMIFLLAFPVHFAYDATWPLFQDYWNNPPRWASLLPLVELVLSLTLTFLDQPAFSSGRHPWLSHVDNGCCARIVL